MQCAITVLILGCFQGIEGVTKSRLPPEALQSLPPPPSTPKETRQVTKVAPVLWDGLGHESIRGYCQVCSHVCFERVPTQHTQ